MGLWVEVRIVNLAAVFLGIAGKDTIFFLTPNVVWVSNATGLSWGALTVQEIASDFVIAAGSALSITTSLGV